MRVRRDAVRQVEQVLRHVPDVREDRVQLFGVVILLPGPHLLVDGQHAPSGVRFLNGKVDVDEGVPVGDRAGRLTLPVHAHRHLDTQPPDRAVPCLEPVAQPAGDHTEEEIVDRHPFAQSVRCATNGVERMVDERDLTPPPNRRVQRRGPARGSARAGSRSAPRSSSRLSRKRRRDATRRPIP